MLSYRVVHSCYLEPFFWRDIEPRYGKTYLMFIPISLKNAFSILWFTEIPHIKSTTLTAVSKTALSKVEEFLLQVHDDVGYNDAWSRDELSFSLILRIQNNVHNRSTTTISAN